MVENLPSYLYIRKRCPRIWTPFSCIVAGERRMFADTQAIGATRRSTVIIDFSMRITDRSKALLAQISQGREMTRRDKLELAAWLSVPAVVAQFSSIVMQYIDASMVGSLGAEASASIGLVTTTTWLFGGLCSACSTGFSVQVAHKIGANDLSAARSILRQAFTTAFLFSIMLAVIGLSICRPLPLWLGGDASIVGDASLYFGIFSLSLPMLQLNFVAGGMLRCSGNMHVPSMMGVAMCMLDVLFNFLFIFPTHHFSVAGVHITIPGANLGVAGAALGTVAAITIIALVQTWYLCNRSSLLRIVGEKGRFRPQRSILRWALKIGFPMGMEHVVLCGAQIMTTVIVAPLGVFAIAANSFAITAESLCYMPGLGISEAATTLVGQSIGAARKTLARSFAYITVGMGMLVMALMGILMYVFAPEFIGFMSPVEEIRQLGTAALRIEAFAEPMFAASIVAYGVFVGAANTVVPCIMNVFSIWAVRLTLAAALAPSLGLQGVWTAMCIELCFRGTIFLLRLFRGRWLK